MLEDGLVAMLVEEAQTRGDALGMVGYSYGLKYISNGDGTCYVGGVNNCTDKNVIIADERQLTGSAGYPLFIGKGAEI